MMHSGKMKLTIAIIAAATVLVACQVNDTTQVASIRECVNPTITPASASLAAGDTLRVHASPLFSCNGAGPLLAYWHSNNTAIATVDSASGLVTARSVGTASIVIVAAIDPAVASAMVVRVTP